MISSYTFFIIQDSGKKKDKIITEDGRIIISEIEDENMEQYIEKCVLTISIPKEIYPEEKRVAISPIVAKKLVKLGFLVKIETRAGELAGFTDLAYKKAGCEIVNTAYELWDQADILIKIRAPMENSSMKGFHEADVLNKNARLLVSYIYPAKNIELLEKLYHQRPSLVVFALDCTPRITRAQKLDTLSSTANLIGYR